MSAVQTERIWTVFVLSRPKAHWTEFGEPQYALARDADLRGLEPQSQVRRRGVFRKTQAIYRLNRKHGPETRTGTFNTRGRRAHFTRLSLFDSLSVQRIGFVLFAIAVGIQSIFCPIRNQAGIVGF